MPIPDRAYRNLEAFRNYLEGLNWCDAARIVAGALDEVPIGASVGAYIRTDRGWVFWIETTRNKRGGGTRIERHRVDCFGSWLLGGRMIPDRSGDRGAWLRIEPAVLEHVFRAVSAERPEPGEQFALDL